MRSLLTMAIGCVLIGGSLARAWAAEGDAARDDAPQDDEVRRVVALIDGHLESRWREDNITPTELADDAEFLRRAALDLNGRIPTVMEAREFLADNSPHKREALINRLLDDPRYTVHFTHFWRKVLIPEVETNIETRYLTPGFESWLRTKLLDNTSYRDFVREILDVDISDSNMYAYTEATPTAFYAAKEIKPENLAAATSRMFLGVRIECAQCHDHPFDHWTRRDFWGYAAFFAGLERNRGGADGIFAGIREFFGQRKVQIPDSDEFVEPTFLGGDELQRGSGRRPRQALTHWIVSESNPYFARMLVNRMWGHFFGVGFVEPVDDFSNLHPPSHPELLDSLAEEFIAHEYDMKFLIRAMTLSRAYQLSSRQTDPSQSEPQQFAKMSIKGLSPEQVFDSLQQATGRFEPFHVGDGYEFFGTETPRSRLQDLFTDSGTTPVDRPTTVLQSLALMNGDLIAEETHATNSRLLASVIDFPGFDTADRVETIFLAALTRRPTDEERETFIAYVESGGPHEDSQRALSDIFWVLLNSSEFLYNH